MVSDAPEPIATVAAPMKVFEVAVVVQFFAVSSQNTLAPTVQA